MNHYAEESDNKRLDRMALSAMQTGDPKRLLDACIQYRISMCGVIPAVLIMQTLLELGHRLKVTEVSYATSADAGLDPHRVVGYAGVIISDAGN
jgi:AmmeMemoRadiSam system protein B